MKRNPKNEYEHLMKRFPTLTPLDIYYFALKNYGVKDEKTDLGRPTWNLIDSNSLYHITFGTTEEDSPFSIKDRELLIGKKQLPFRVDFIERIPVKVGRYHYFRHADYITPTLDDKLILNVNFKRQCNLCDFCQFKLYAQPDISVEKGFNDLIKGKNTNDLSDISQIAIVTGLFGNENKVMDHIKQIVNRAIKEKFNGEIFYMGFEIKSEKATSSLVKYIKGKGLKNFKIAYTVEMFEDRKRLMHRYKSHQTLKEVEETLKKLKESGVKDLEYTYIPGLDDLDDFKKGAEKLVKLAKPHISIFRPWAIGQRKRQTKGDYQRLGVLYLCAMRTFFEDLYKEKIYGNNLGNMWPFPLNRIDTRWVKGQIEGPNVGRRYWAGKEDLRST